MVEISLYLVWNPKILMENFPFIPTLKERGGGGGGNWGETNFNFKKKN